MDVYGTSWWLNVFLKNHMEHNYLEDLGRAGNRICGVYSLYRTFIIQDMSSFQIYIYICIYIYIDTSDCITYLQSGLQPEVGASKGLLWFDVS